MLKEAGLHYRWVHATRHTYATRLIMAGANLVYVQHQLGHSSIQVTVDLYCHWIELAKRTNVLEVDLLAVSPQNEETSCTVGCTSNEDKPEVLGTKEEKWGE